MAIGRQMYKAAETRLGAMESMSRPADCRVTEGLDRYQSCLTGEKPIGFLPPRYH